MGDSFNRASGEGLRTRPDYGEATPDSAQAMYRLEEFSKESGLERPLLELVRTRVSQINGCAVCTDVQTANARAAGETEQRLFCLMGAWRESPYYTERERAALAWAEAVTNMPQLYEADEEYEAARAQFSAEELVKLTVVVIAINGWNRLATASRSGQPDSWGRHDHRAEDGTDNDPHGDLRSGRSDVLARFQRHDE